MNNLDGIALVGRCNHPVCHTADYRGTSLIRNCAPAGAYSRPMSRALWRGLFLMSEAPLYNGGS